ncbi:MAG: hypothetical protein QNJ36_21130 [Calothrix sp. MO_167.B42]|nr:hypothetical protein [Calothrix sp. MO_167.B42]
MDLDLILNELSLRNLAKNELIARQWMSNLIQTIRAVKSQGVKVNLRTKDNFHITTLAENYPLRRWLNDNHVNQEERLFIKTLATKAPFSNDIANLEIKDIENSTGLWEFSYQGEQVIGLGVAYLLETIAVSFLSEDCWDCHCINIDCQKIDEDGEIIDEVIEIIHASHKNHVPNHARWIQDRISTGIVDGEDIWDKKEELFSNLDFCDNVGKQLINIRAGQLELQPVVKALSELQKCCENWKTGYFNLKGYPLQESGESKPTLDKYSKERTFLCPDGQERLFERHVKLRVCNWRIHFFPLQPEAEIKVIIGYIGRHLPTVNYPT